MEGDQVIKPEVHNPIFKQVEEYEYYLAAPFFNNAQVKLVENVEAALLRNGKTYYSPREYPLNAEDGVTTEKAQAILDSNVTALMRSKIVLAVCDYMMPDGVALMLVRGSGGGQTFQPVYMPDTGVVWEVGYGFAQGKEIVLYTDTKGRPINAMLVPSARGVVVGLSGLEEYLSGRVQLQQWQGGIR